MTPASAQTGRGRPILRHWLLLTVVLALTACGLASSGELTVVEPPARLVTADPAAVDTASGGEVTVAYPDEPGGWYPLVAWDPAAVDLAHLWGAPLYRYDEHGQLVPALAASASTEIAPDGSFHVEVELHPGRWTDGRPVVAADVVATIEALRGPLETEFSVVERAEVVDDHTVRLSFAQPYGRWPHLLAGGRSVLPAHVLADDGLGAYRAEVPVSAGPFRLTAREHGLRARFEAHPASPLGAPALDAIEVLAVPSYETALGLLDRRKVDVVLGHVALDPRLRAERLDGVEAAAPVGGTWVGLRWWASGGFGGSERAALRRRTADALALDELAEGLVRDDGTRATSPIPGVEGPWGSGVGVEPLDDVVGVLDVVRWHELPSFAARAVSRSVASRAGSLSLVSAPAADLVADPSRRHEGSVLIFRDGPRPALASLVGGAGHAPDIPEAVRSVDAAVRLDADVATPAFDVLVDEANVLPLFQVGVAQVWRGGVEGVTPSSWPGLAFWNASAWRLAEAGIPRG